MALKSKASKKMEVVSPKVIFASRFMLVDDIDTSEESGWRATDLQRVDELFSSFMQDGHYGRTILSKPSLRSFGGQPKMGTASGKQLLVDGKRACVCCVIPDPLPF